MNNDHRSVVPEKYCELLIFFSVIPKTLALCFRAFLKAWEEVGSFVISDTKAGAGPSESYPKVGFVPLTENIHGDTLCVASLRFQFVI